MPAGTGDAVAGATPQRKGNTRSGRVVSARMDKTVVVAVERLVQHPAYKRVVKRTTKLYAHDERNACKIGDVVTVVESRPLSKTKRWRVRAILREGRPLIEDHLPDEPEMDTGRPTRKHKTDSKSADDAEEGGA